MIETVSAAVLNKASAEISLVAITFLLAYTFVNWIWLSRSSKEVLLMEYVWIWIDEKKRSVVGFLDDGIIRIINKTVRKRSQSVGMNTTVRKISGEEL